MVLNRKDFIILNQGFISSTIPRYYYFNGLRLSNIFPENPTWNMIFFHGRASFFEWSLLDFQGLVLSCFCCHGPPNPTFLEVFIVNSLVFRWPKPLFFMVLGATMVFIRSSTGLMHASWVFCIALLVAGGSEKHLSPVGGNRIHGWCKKSGKLTS